MLPRYKLLSIDFILNSFEVELIDMLHDYGLIGKPLSIDVRKIIMFMFIKNIKLILPISGVLMYHAGKIDSNHELLTYYDEKKINTLINRLCEKIRKNTRKLFFLSKNPPSQILCPFNTLDGCIQDEIILLQSETVDPKKLKRFLNSFKINDLFSKYVATEI